jgi:hypothetical protein
MTANEEIETIDLLAALQRSFDRHLASREPLGDEQDGRSPAPKPDHPTPKNLRAQNAAERIPTTYGCGGCDNRWPGVSRAHCSGCHRTFAAFGLFDRHRRMREEIGSCLDPETITSKSKDGDERRVMYLVNGIWSSVEERGESIGRRMRKTR